jgi:hypothetical protein
MPPTTAVCLPPRPSATFATTRSDALKRISPERTPTLRGLGQVPAGLAVADALGKVGYVLQPNVRWEGIDGDEIQLVELDRIFPVDGCVAGPERDLARSRVNQPTVLVASGVREMRRRRAGASRLCDAGSEEVDNTGYRPPEAGPAAKRDDFSHAEETARVQD